MRWSNSNLRVRYQCVINFEEPLGSQFSILGLETCSAVISIEFFIDLTSVFWCLHHFLACSNSCFRRGGTYNGVVTTSATGNQTPVSRVTGGDTSHYTIADDIFKLFSNQFFLLTRQVRVTVSFDIWGISSVGRARAQHARGLGFDSQILHFEKIFHISPNADLNYRPCHY